MSIGRKFSISIGGLISGIVTVACAQGGPPSNKTGDIIVTATRATTGTKTDTAIIDTPQSIGVVTSAQVEARGAIGLQEALRYSAGVRTEPNGSDFRFDYVTARGGFNAARYVDGMRTPDSSFAPRTEIYNLERIEVLRGPSSVLYGQGAAGGILNSITKRPDFKRKGEISIEYGSFNRKQIQGDITGALNAEGTIAARLVAVYRDANNQVDFGKDDRIMVAPSLRFRPDDRTDIVIEGLYQRDRAASIASFLPLAATLQAPPGRELPWGAYLGEPSHNFYNSEQASGTLLVMHRFSDAITYTGAVRYSHSTAHNGDIEPSVWDGLVNPFLDADNRVIGRYRYDSRGTADMVTTDNTLRFDFETGPFRHKFLVGVDYLRSRIDSATIYTDAAPIDIHTPAYSPTNVPTADFENDPRAVDTQLGFYVQDQIDYRDLATVVLGVRRDRAVNEVAGNPRQVDKATSFRAGLVLHPITGLSPYVSYSESFLPTIGRDFYDKPFVPQRGTQYEIGIKWQPDSATLLAVAAYSIRGSNLLQTDPMNGNNQIQIGKVKSRGVEVEASHTLARNFTVSASYTYTHARTGRSVDSLDQELPISGVPTHQASIFGERSFALDAETWLRIGGGLRYVGPSTEAAIFNDIVPDGAIERLTTPGFTLVDALVLVEHGRWALSVNATNLFDKHYYATCSVRSACGVGFGRNVIGTLGYRF
jgi:iron complex outermembrane receptor protein